MRILRYTGQTNNKIDKHGIRNYDSNYIEIIPAPWDRYSNTIIKEICHLHLSSRINSYLSIPFKSIWYSAITEGISSEEDACVMLNAHLFAIVDESFLKYIRKKFGKCALILYFSDKYSYFIRNYRGFPSIERLRETYDIILTYNRNDADAYGFDMIRPLIPDYSDIEVDNDIESSDVFFVGQDKGRLDDLINIYDLCTNNNLRCDFYIMGVPEEKQIYREGIKYNKWMDYKSVLSHIKQTKCIVNLIQKGSSGITMRDYEAIGNGKLMITNNELISKTELYDEKQIIWINELETQIDRIRKGYNPRHNIAQQYDEEHFYKWIQEISIERRELLVDADG